MHDICSLATRHCIPCQSSMPALNQSEIKQLLAALPSDWVVNQQGHLYKRYPFQDFMTAFNWARQIAVLAEEASHHPDLTIAWGSCAVEIWTHRINGLSENDFILAAKIEQLK